MLVAFVNSKGGVGKSTLAVHLAMRAAEQGQRVALIDADKDQQAGSAWLETLQAPVTVRRWFTPKEVLSGAEALSREHHLVIADGPAGLSEVTRALLLKADLAVIPCGPSGMDLRAARAAARLVDEARAARPKDAGAPRALFVPNRLQPEARLSRELAEAAADLSIPSCEGLRLRQAYAEAGTQYTLVWRLSGPWIAEAGQEMIRTLTQIQTAYEETLRT